MNKLRGKDLEGVGYSTVLNKALETMRNGVLLEVYYIKKQNKTRNRYEVSPLDLTEDSLYAYDPTEDTIKRFLISGIVQVGRSSTVWTIPDNYKYEVKLKESQEDAQDSSNKKE